MTVAIYKEVQIDASHGCSITRGSARTSTATAGKIEVWVEGEPDATTGILIDYNVIKQVIGKYQTTRSSSTADDPMVPAIEKFQHVLTNPG